MQSTKPARIIFLLSMLLSAMALLAVVVTVPYFGKATATRGLAVYLLVYTLLPMVTVWLLWLRPRFGLGLSLIWAALLSVRAIGGSSAMMLGAPLSLGIPVGDFSEGTGWLIDPLFIGISSISAVALVQLRKRAR
ncbi:hypothetical protein FLM48_21815 [Shewanella sp. Scap07]|uniref:hypothetical protein n=1 Tax=Shewanella sp. Scap07 TaxID=2589987 RepID=UPI0015C1892C|nr:hypothetical protein [Shewanella sp. Scap07]QLE87478.1 hypothetical protein FLM48_21815 [Shewanella sp. Scap07]